MARPGLNSNAQYAYNYYKKKHGYTDVQAAGMVGNLMQESTMNTGARNAGDGRDGSDSIGIGQWNGSRATGLKRFAADTGRDWTDLDAQLDYTVYEKQNSERRAGQMLSSATTIDGATDAGISFERPQGWSANNPRGGHGYDNRLNWAKEAYAQYSGNNPDEVIGSYTPTAQATPQESAVAQSAVPTEAKKEPMFPGLRSGIKSAMEAIGFSGEGTKESPSKFMGLELGGDDGLVADLAGISKAFGGSEQQQAPQVSGKAPSAPVEVKFDIASTASQPTAEELRKKRLGGLGGFGGFRSFGRA